VKRLLLLLLLAFAICPTLAQTPTTLTLWTPQSYQIFQRGHNGIRIVGEVRPAGSYSLEASFAGAPYTLLASGITRAFDVWLPASSGQGPLLVRLIETGQVVQRDYVGVGDVFVVAGQSNAVGYGLRYQAAYHPTYKAAVFGNNYQWKALADPVDSATGQVDIISSDSSALGSVWPLVATYIMADQNIPVAFVPAAKGGSSILQWLPTDIYNRRTLFGSMLNRIEAVEGVKAVLWWQGETDAYNKMSDWVYSDHLMAIAAKLHERTGTYLVTTLLGDITYAPAEATWNINAGILAAMEESPVILPGPDLSDIRSDDTAHFRTDEKLRLAAERWWLALKTLFYS